MQLPIQVDHNAPLAELDAVMPHFMADLRAWRSVAGQKVSQRVKYHSSPTVHTPLRPKSQSRYQFQALQWARAYQEVRHRGLITDVALPEDLTFVELWSLTSRSRARATKRLRISPKSITRFASKRSPVSIQSDQPFRLMSITGSRARTRG